jgi:hypothetical protein
MKKIVSLALLGATTSLMAMYAEQASLYKDPRIMGMGGVNVAVGGYSTSVFSNPAGLANIKKEYGLVVDLLSIGLSGTAEMNNFINDINDASDADDETEAMSDVLKKYSGEHFHTDVSSYMSVSKNSEMFAWSIGLLTAVDVNLMAHGNGSTNAELLETTSRVYGGVVLGAAKPYQTKYGQLDVGLDFKYIALTSYEGTLGISELTSDDDESIEDKLQDRYEKKTTGLGVDLGVIFKPSIPQISNWHPAFGLSIMNIGSIDMDDNYGGQPMTVNLGASVSPEVKYIDSLTIGMDYVDLFNANKLRIYNLDNPDGTSSYTDYDTSSFMKNFRLGVSAGLIDSTYFSSTLNFGLYQGAYTAGFNLELTILKLNFATYQEEVGDSTSSIDDRRYMAQIVIGW